MRKRSRTVSGEARKLPNEQEAAPYIAPWRPFGMKTGLKNRLIGKKVSVVVRRKA
jgi:hypothetical protein